MGARRGSALPHRADVQGLRAIAVALVVGAHSGLPLLAGGFIGVDVFFVISGYLITGLLLNEWTATGQIRYARFVARRLRRLLPVLLLVLLFTLGAALVLLSLREVEAQSQSLIYAATWSSNFFFALRDWDYFAALEAKDWFLHTWSLSVEEQFYLVWPWLLLAMLFRVHPSSATRRLHIGLGALIVASFLLCVYWLRNQPPLAFYMMPARAWQFAVGGIVFLWTQRSPDWPPVVSSLIGFSGLAAIVGSAAILDHRVPYPGHYAVAPTLGAAAVLAARSGPRFLTSSMLGWLGDRSYSIYLWHWPLLLLGGALLPHHPAGIAAALVAVVSMSALSYRWVELPFWKGRFSQGKPALAVTGSVVSIAATSMLAHALTAGSLVSTAAVSVTDFDPRQDAPPIYGEGFRCDTGHLSDELEPCGIGPSDASHTVVVIGDSIGAQWVSVFPQIYAPPDWQIIVLTKSACPMVDEDYFYARIGKTYQVCTTWRRKALEHIGQLRPDVVFVGSAADYDFSPQQWSAGTARVLAPLAEAARRVVVLAPTPSLGFDGPSCLSGWNRSEKAERACSVSLDDVNTDHLGDQLRRLAMDFPNVQVLDLQALVCPDRRCTAREPSGAIVFRDDRHITNSFALSRSAAIRHKLVELSVHPGALNEVQQGVSP